MNDLISRQQAIDEIHEDAEWLASQGSDWQVERMDDLMRDKFMELVYDLLSDDEDNIRANMIINCADEYAESMKQQWIPVEERLPEPWTLVLVTDSCKNVSMCQLSWGDNNWYDESENWIYFHDSVVAWMPLPEPYQGGGQE